MTKEFRLFAILLMGFCIAKAQPNVTFPAAKVDFDAFEALTKEVKEYRKDRLVNLNTFLQMSKEENVIILDTRSDLMYLGKHVKGAIHLNFSDFTQENLAKIIPSFDTKILIYCNNNFDNDDKYFVTKAEVPAITVNKKEVKPITLALNIPTYINLYGYGYRNVYELSEFVDANDPRITFEGIAVSK